MNKKKLKLILITIFILLLTIILISWLYYLKNKNESYKDNIQNEQYKEISKDEEIKKIYLSHQNKLNKEKNEKVKPKHKITELTILYDGSYCPEEFYGSHGNCSTHRTYHAFNCFNGSKIAISQKNQNLIFQKTRFGTPLSSRLKFKISFSVKDVQKHWRIGKTGPYYDYYFDENNTKFQLEKLPIQWENSQSFNDSFLGKWKIDLKKSIESGFGKITPKIKQRIEEQLSRDYNQLKETQWHLVLEVCLENDLPTIHYWGHGGKTVAGSTFFWIKNFNDFLMACFTNFHPSYGSKIIFHPENAVLTSFKLNKNKDILTIYNPGLVIGICSIGNVDSHKVLGWKSYTRNKEFKKLHPYFINNAYIIAKKIG